VEVQPEAILTGDGATTAFRYVTNAVSFSVAKGRYLALRVTNQGSSSDTLRVGGSWSYVSAPQEVQQLVRSLGDVTDNGVVTAFDAAWVLQHTVGLHTLTGVDSTAADVSGRMGISAYDASLILQYVIDKIKVFPADTGGVDDPATKALALLRTISVGEATPESDGGLGVPILIDEMEGVVAGEMTLCFEGNGGNVTVRSTDLTSGYLFASNVQKGRVQVSFAGSESNAGPGPVLDVVFDESDACLLRSLRLRRVSLNEGRIPVQIVKVEAEIPTSYRLGQNYPNPFNPETMIRYDLPEAGQVHLLIYNVSGQLVRTLVDEDRPAGSFRATWDGADDSGRSAASGIYFVKMKAGDFVQTNRALLIR